MRRATRSLWVAGAAAGGLAAASTAVVRSAVIWNNTTSAPLGLYRVRSARALRVGDWLAVRPPPTLAAWLSARGYLPAGALLIKQVAALSPSRVCREGDRITVDGVLRGHVEAVDRWGRKLPVWRGCRALTPPIRLLIPA